jgi:hypothetical protein
LDFIYLAQYPAHDSDTLQYLQEALDRFHKNREYFIITGIRKDFNIPKFHSLLHYIEAIELFGTTDNYNTEMFERLHIDFAKHGWRASNQRDEFPQMIRWLSRQEKVISFEFHQKNIQHTQNNINSDAVLRQPLAKKKAIISIAKHPNFPSRQLSLIEDKHDAPYFIYCLKVFLNSFTTKKVPNRYLNESELPFKHVNVYNMFRFHPQGIHDEEEESDIVRAFPRSAQHPCGRFDTVIAIINETAESTGLAGKRPIIAIYEIIKKFCQGTRVGRVRVIFTLPEEVQSITGIRPAPSNWPKDPLVYIEWYSRLENAAKPRNGMMYCIKKVSSTTMDQGTRVQAAILPLSSIRQSCMLFPVFPISVPAHWTPDSVLDYASSFYINNWLSKYDYQTIW